MKIYGGTPHQRTKIREVVRAFGKHGRFLHSQGVTVEIVPEIRASKPDESSYESVITGVYYPETNCILLREDYCYKAVIAHELGHGMDYCVSKPRRVVRQWGLLYHKHPEIFGEHGAKRPQEWYAEGIRVIMGFNRPQSFQSMSGITKSKLAITHPEVFNFFSERIT